MGKSSRKSLRIPKCKTRCVKSFHEKYKLYETRSYCLYKVCSCCGYEFNFRQYPACPYCGGFRRNFYNNSLRGVPGMYGRFNQDGRCNTFSRFRPEFEQEYCEEEPFYTCPPEFEW